jgi:release factor glutamine methyltransferase
VTSAREAVEGAAARLREAGVPTPEVDASWRAAHVLGVPRSQLALADDLDAEAQARLDDLVARRERREPLAYVLGEWGFRGLTLLTDARALVPRPETEVVVERCLALVASEPAPRVLDVGVGSGAIALAIAQEHPGARVTGVDVSPGALALARANARLTGAEVELREGGLDAAAEGWDLVVSNPPYVAERELARLEPEVRDWEPRLALVGEGLHGQLARLARTRWLVLEVGDGQAEAVAADLRALGYRDVAVTSDLGGSPRVVEGRSG